MIDRPRAGEPRSIQKPGAFAAMIASLRSPSTQSTRSSRPRLPPSLIGRASSEIDWRLTVIAAFSFLAHFGFVGSVYSDWLDPLVDDGPTIAGLVDALKITPLPVEQAPTPLAPSPVLVTTATAPTAIDRHGGTSAPSPGRPSGAASGGGDRARLVAQAESREMAIISALGGSGNATNTLRDGQATTQKLDEAAAGREGITVGRAPALRFGDGGGDLVTPGRRGGLSDIGGTTAGVPGGAGSGTTVKPPGGIARLDPLVERYGNVPNADRTVAGLKASYRRCYMRGLESAPDAEGSVELSVKISANGEVASVSASGGAHLGSEIVGCLVKRTTEAHFDPPQGSSATVVIPITFALQR
jgi:hypothetical protein